MLRNNYPAYFQFARRIRECRMTIALQRSRITSRVVRELYVSTLHRVWLYCSARCGHWRGAFFRLTRYRGTAIPFVEEYAMAAPFKLAPLPWDDDALAPTISANTISFHYYKHHQAYVDMLNKL